MSSALLLSLVGLALLDSTSTGTLFIPVWLLSTPGRVKAGRILVYLLTVAVFYFAVGLLVVRGADSLASRAGEALDSRAALWVQLGIGVGLFLLSFRFDPKRRAKKDAGGGGVMRWRERATGGSSSMSWMIGLGLLAGVAEVALMLPYLGAIGMITTSDVSTPAAVALIAGYCAVMVLPALLLLAGRILARSTLEPLLQRMDGWIARHAAGTTGWVLAIAGFLVARDAGARLWFPDKFGS